MGLAIIMAGATVVTVGSMGMAAALLELVAGLLSAFVAYGRWQLEPLRDRITAYDHRSQESLTHSMSR